MLHTDHTFPSIDSGSGDRRDEARVQVLGQIQGSLVAPGAPVIVREVGMGGFSVEARECFAIGTEYEFRFSPRRGEPVNIRARAVHCQLRTAPGPDAWFLAGFELIGEPTGPVAAVLESFIAEMMRSFD